VRWPQSSSRSPRRRRRPLTLLLPDVTLGAQQPRIEHLPVGALSSSGAEAVALAETAGLYLDPWQQHALDVALGERADGSWAAFEVGLIVGRQNGKGSVIEARELAGLFLFGEELIVHTAHVFSTAKEGFRRIRRLIESTPDMAAKVAQIRQSNEEVSIELRSGQRLRFLARNSVTGRGLTGDCVILDEAYRLGPDEMGALLPTLSARPNPQIWYTSSAAKRDSHQLHAARARALAGSSARLAWLEWSTDPDAYNEDDPVGWAQANPALGRRISLEFIRGEREALDPAEFRRERLGVPDEPVGHHVPVIDPVQWAALAGPTSEPGSAVAFVVDVAPSGTDAAIALAGLAADGRLHLELVDARPGTDWVAVRRAELEERWPGAVWALDPSGPAVELRSDGVWHELTAKDVGEAFAGLLAGVRDRTLVWRTPEHLERPLRDAMAGAARQVYADGAARWSRRRSSVNISPLVALTLAVFAGEHLASEAGDVLQAVW
jgi:hypothetical protein